MEVADSYHISPLFQCCQLLPDLGLQLENKWRQWLCHVTLVVILKAVMLKYDMGDPKCKHCLTPSSFHLYLPLATCVACMFCCLEEIPINRIPNWKLGAYRFLFINCGTSFAINPDKYFLFVYFNRRKLWSYHLMALARGQMLFQWVESENTKNRTRLLHPQLYSSFIQQICAHYFCRFE